MEITRRKLLIGERYLSFELSNENYCIDIRRVREIMGMTDITPIPQVPSFIKGVINLRGQIIPIIDLRLKFGLAFLEYSKRSCIMVVEVNEDDEMIRVGLAVDSIDEVINLPEDKISRLDYLNSTIKTDYIRGISHSEDGMKIVLDIEKILKDADFGTLGAATSESA